MGKLTDIIRDTKPSGSIMVEQAYAQGKMLDHSGWSPTLPRGITPSDIDMVLANGNRFLFVEISRTCWEWQHIKTGQRRLYHDLVARTVSSFACLVHHRVPSAKQINTLRDISSFALMLNIDGNVRECSAVLSWWPEFVSVFYNGDIDGTARAVYERYSR